MTTPLLPGSWSGSTPADTYWNTTDSPAESFAVASATQYIRMIYPPIFLLFGTFGNVMTIIIMRRTASRDSAIDIYFIATAVFDSIALMFTMVQEWVVYTFAFSIIATHVVLCKTYLWFSIGGGAISCWCLVCLTVHRTVSVVWPHLVNVICTRRRVLLGLTGITTCFAVFYSHYLIGYERVFEASTESYVCTVRDNNVNYLYFLENVFIYTELLFYSLLPFTFLAVSNGVLVWKLSMSIKATSSLSTQGDSNTNKSREQIASSVTMTAIVVSLAFLILTLPASVNYGVNYFDVERQMVSGYELALKDFTTTVCFLLRHANNAVNFYLYCLTGRRFREEFIKVMCFGRSREGRSASQQCIADSSEKSTRQSQSSASTVNTH